MFWTQNISNLQYFKLFLTICFSENLVLESRSMTASWYPKSPSLLRKRKIELFTYVLLLLIAWSKWSSVCVCVCVCTHACVCGGGGEGRSMKGEGCGIQRKWRTDYISIRRQRMYEQYTIHIHVIDSRKFSPGEKKSPFLALALMGEIFVPC